MVEAISKGCFKKIRDLQTDIAKSLVSAGEGNWVGVKQILNRALSDLNEAENACQVKFDWVRSKLYEAINLVEDVDQSLLLHSTTIPQNLQGKLTKSYWH